MQNKSCTQRPLLFLDIDGVLHNVLPQTEREYFRKNCMNQLLRICNETNCDIVLSSQWREFPLKVKLLNKVFQEHQLPKIIGMTPELLFGSRTDAISSWLRRNSKRSKNIPFVVLDDLVLPRLSDHAIDVNPLYGLSKADADKAITILKKPSGYNCKCTYCTKSIYSKSTPIIINFYFKL